MFICVFLKKKKNKINKAAGSDVAMSILQIVVLSI